MNCKVHFKIGTYIICLFTWLLVSCNGKAKDPKDAAEKLVSADTWKIDQILVNDVATFKDGKMIKQFGGIDFERYMETVQFKANGKFEGVFKGETKPMELRWMVGDKDISISAPDQKGGAWSVLPADVTADSFTMTTQSTAYDYPRMTKIALIFKAGK